MKRYKKVCSTCESDDIFADAVVYWNETNQQWELQEFFLDNCFCNDCNETCSSEEIEIT